MFENARRVMSGEVLKRVVSHLPAWNKEVISGRAGGWPRLGHTPGHTSHVVFVGIGQGLWCRPTSPTRRSCLPAIPAGTPYYDQDPVLAETTRRKVYDMLVAEKMMVQGFHYPFPSVRPCLEDLASGYREIPVAWNPVL